MLGTRQSGLQRSSASRGCPRTPSCSSAPGCAPARCSTRTRSSSAPEHALLGEALLAAYGADALEPIPA